MLETLAVILGIFGGIFALISLITFLYPLIDDHEFEWIPLCGLTICVGIIFLAIHLYESIPIPTPVITQIASNTYFLEKTDHKGDENTWLKEQIAKLQKEHPEQEIISITPEYTGGKYSSTYGWMINVKRRGELL